MACNRGTFSHNMGLVHGPAGAFERIQTAFTQDQCVHLTICGANVPEGALNWDKVEVSATSVSKKKKKKPLISCFL